MFKWFHLFAYIYIYIYIQAFELHLSLLDMSSIIGPILLSFFFCFKWPRRAREEGKGDETIIGSLNNGGAEAWVSRSRGSKRHPFLELGAPGGALLMALEGRGSKIDGG